jgi:ribosomal protein S18 acetylase RimI-like enzyme
MTREVQVRRLMPEDAADYRAIRLAALKQAPEAFGSTYAAEADRPLAAFAERLTSAAVFGAFVDGRIAGLMVFRQADGAKDAHKAHLYGVFVAPEARGAGVGDALLSAVIAYGRDHVEQILLAVVADNTAAIRLYERHGFVTYGVEPRALKSDGRYFDEILMVRMLR